jgi:hypothetical protein
MCDWRVYWGYKDGYYRFTHPEQLYGEHRGHTLSTKAEAAARPLTSINEVPEQVYVQLTAFVQDKVSASTSWKVITLSQTSSHIIIQFIILMLMVCFCG